MFKPKNIINTEGQAACHLPQKAGKPEGRVHFCVKISPSVPERGIAVCRYAFHLINQPFRYTARCSPDFTRKIDAACAPGTDSAPQLIHSFGAVWGRQKVACTSVLFTVLCFKLRSLSMQELPHQNEDWVWFGLLSNGCPVQCLLEYDTQ